MTFLNRDGEQEHAWGTSWGFTTRMIGATIMAHGDDAGCACRPRSRRSRWSSCPIYRTDDERASVVEPSPRRLRADIAAAGIRVRLDDREQHRPGYKFAEWELKGVPMRIELGPRDVAAGQRGDRATPRAATRRRSAWRRSPAAWSNGWRRRSASLYADALAFREANTHQIGTFDAFATGVEEQGGFWAGLVRRGLVRGGDRARTKATIRFLPIEPTDPGAACIHCGKPGVDVATWARAY